MQPLSYYQMVEADNLRALKQAAGLQNLKI